PRQTRPLRQLDQLMQARPGASVLYEIFSKHPARAILVNPCSSPGEHAKGRDLDVEGRGLNHSILSGALLPLPSAGIIQIRFTGSVIRPLRLPLSQSAPLAA